MCSAPAAAGRARSCFTSARAREFERFFARADTFSLGVCNGCQMFAVLKELIPGAQHWPRFLRNRSEQFEARLSLVRDRADRPRCCWRAWPARACRSPSRTAKGGRNSQRRADLQQCLDQRLVAFRYISNRGESRSALSGQSERRGARHRGADHAGRARHHHHAAPRARLSQRAELLASARRRRGQRLDAHVPQRARCGCG